jgi:hypothetical protein
MLNLLNLRMNFGCLILKRFIDLHNYDQNIYAGSFQNYGTRLTIQKVTENKLLSRF